MQAIKALGKAVSRILSGGRLLRRQNSNAGHAIALTLPTFCSLPDLRTAKTVGTLMAS